MNWRQPLRLALVHLGLVFVLVTFLLVVWMTRQPEAPLFGWLVEQPLVGGLAERIRSHYLPADPTAEASQRGTEDAATSEAPVTRFVGVGAALRSAPQPDAAVIHETQRLELYEVVGQRNRWLELRWGRSEGLATVWFDPSAARDLTPPLGDDPQPPAPLHARAPSAGQIEVARAELGQVLELRRSGYDVLTDLAQERRGDLLRWFALLADAEGAYERAYGLVPLGEPAETIVLFRTEAAYRRFQSQIEGLEGAISTGHAADGIVALFVEGRAPEEIATTLLHEVGHLLNRRSVGPALPLWLEEGLAEDFAHFSGPGARDLASYRDVTGNSVRIWGPLAGLHRLAEGGFADLSLTRLANYDQDLFVRSSDAIELYTASGFLIRLLRTSSHPALGSGSRLRRFLEAVANGGSPTLATLVELQVPGLDSLSLEELESILREELVRLYHETPGLTFDSDP